jgi:hypothetical protein
MPDRMYGEIAWRNLRPRDFNPMSSVSTVLLGSTVHTQKRGPPTTKKKKQTNPKTKFYRQKFCFYQSKKTVQCSDTRAILYGDARRAATHVTYSFRDAIPGATARANRLFALEIRERLFERKTKKETHQQVRQGRIQLRRGEFSRTATRFGFDFISGSGKKGIRTGSGRKQAEQ